jgi:hypothetical protein
VGGPGYSHDRAANTPTSGDKRSVNKMNAQEPAVPISRARRVAAAALPKLMTEGRDNLHVKKTQRAEEKKARQEHRFRMRERKNRDHYF